MKSRIFIAFFTALILSQNICANGGSPVVRMARCAAIVATTHALAEARVAAGLAPRIHPYQYLEHRVPMCNPTDAKNPQAPKDVERYRGRDTAAFEADVWSMKRVRFYGNGDLPEVMRIANEKGAQTIQWYVVEGELQWYWDDTEDFNETSDDEDGWIDDLD